MGKIVPFFFFWYVQHFMDKVSLKLIFLNDFYNCNVVLTLLQIKYVLQLIIELFICAPISQHNGKLGCKPPLIKKIHEKIF
jgi:hypothetical protein